MLVVLAKCHYNRMAGNAECLLYTIPVSQLPRVAVKLQRL
jgi:hypothetical protein